MKNVSHESVSRVSVCVCVSVHAARHVYSIRLGFLCLCLLRPLFWEISHYTTLREPPSPPESNKQAGESRKGCMKWARTWVKASVEATTQYPKCLSTTQSCKTEPHLTLTSKSFCLNTHNSIRRAFFFVCFCFYGNSFEPDPAYFEPILLFYMEDPLHLKA